MGTRDHEQQFVGAFGQKQKGSRSRREYSRGWDSGLVAKSGPGQRAELVDKAPSKTSYFQSPVRSRVLLNSSIFSFLK